MTIFKPRLYDTVPYLDTKWTLKGQSLIRKGTSAVFPKGKGVSRSINVSA